MTSSTNPAKEQPEDSWVKTKSPEMVRGMFTNIAGTYDTLNHVFSLNIDKMWRRRLARKTIIDSSISAILDVCGGTGDLALALAHQAAAIKADPQIICSDFTPAMTVLSKPKFAALSRSPGAVIPIPLVADTTRLPFPDNTFDLVTVAFGIRNVVDTLAGLQEMARVCRPGGQIAVLEFSKTRNPLINSGFNLYFSHILPLIGRIVTGTRAYSYLSKSVEAYPEGQQFCDILSKATGSPATAIPLSFGISTLYLSSKS